MIEKEEQYQNSKTPYQNKRGEENDLQNTWKHHPFGAKAYAA